MASARWIALLLVVLLGCVPFMACSNSDESIVSKDDPNPNSKRVVLVEFFTQSG